MIWWLKFIGVAILTFLNDICWTKWSIEVERRHAIQSGLWSAAIYVSGGLTIVSFVYDLKYMIAAVIGSFVGTFLTVSRHKSNKFQ